MALWAPADSAHFSGVPDPKIRIFDVGHLVNWTRHDSPMKPARGHEHWYCRYPKVGAGTWSPVLRAQKKTKPACFMGSSSSGEIPMFAGEKSPDFCRVPPL